MKNLARQDNVKDLVNAEYVRDAINESVTTYLSVVLNLEEGEIIEAPDYDTVHAQYLVNPKFGIRLYNGLYDEDDNLITLYLGEALCSNSFWTDLDENDEPTTYYEHYCCIWDASNTVRWWLTWASGDEVPEIDRGVLSVPSGASIDSNGLISFSDNDGNELFTLQLPLYDGGMT